MSFFGILYISLHSVVYALCACAVPEGCIDWRGYGSSGARNWVLQHG